MTFIIGPLPHDGEKQRGKSLSTPPDPDGYALSPSVNTSVCTLAALSAASTLSTILPVASSPLVPHTAMSPAPIITGAPAMTSSFGGAPDGVGVGLSSRVQQTRSPGNATDHSVRAQAVLTSECKSDTGFDMTGGGRAVIGVEDVEVHGGVEIPKPQSG